MQRIKNCDKINLVNFLSQNIKIIKALLEEIFIAASILVYLDNYEIQQNPTFFWLRVSINSIYDCISP